MAIRKPLTGPRPPTRDEIVKKKQLASTILEHLIEEGLVPELSSTQKATYVETSTPEPEPEHNH